MNLPQKTVIFLTNMITGIWVPVLSMSLLSKGCNLSTLAWVMCCYSATTILFEVPSGIFADRYGRKFTFLLACLCWGIHILLLLSDLESGALVLSLVFYGIGKACCSGSLDALLIEEYIANCGSETLSVITGQLALLQMSGLISGTIIGGLLPSFGHYMAHGILRLVLLLMLTLLCIFYITEKRPSVKKPPVPLSQYLKESIALIHTSAIIPSLFLCAAGVGLILSVLETYWQPALAEFAAPWQLKTFGLISAAGYLASLAGTVLIQKIRLYDEQKQQLGYFLGELMTGICVIIFSFQKNYMTFVILYTLVYFFSGITNILEQTILNRTVSNSQRCGLLSMLSLSLQLGGIFASACAGFAVAKLGFSGVWLAAAILFMFLVCLAGKRKAFR